MPIRFRAADLALLALALLAVAVGGWRLAGLDDGLAIETHRVGATPVTVTRPAESGPDARAPAVLIAHGFAGSRQLMQPFAATLARAGYVAVNFDFLGHGAHPRPLTGDVSTEDGATRNLLDQMTEVAAFARAHPASDGRLALLGHSMGSDIVVRFAQADGDVAATVAVSMFAPTVTAETPANLLVIVGGLEPAMLKDEGRRAVGMVAGSTEPDSPGVAPGETYGRFAEGTARRLVLAGGVEHIGVLYSEDSLVAARDWLDATFQAAGGPSPLAPAAAAPVDGRLAWLGLTLLGIVVAGRPLSRVLPRVAGPATADAAPAPARSWRGFLAVAAGPSLLTPLILWPLPTSFLPILLGDYLTAHFAVYGALTGLGLLWWHKRGRADEPPSGSAGGRRVAWPAFAAASAAVTAYAVLAVGLPIDRFFTAFVPIPERWPLIAAVLVGTLPYFLADEALVRDPRAPRLAYPVTKAFLMVSLAIAVALDLQRLFFLIILIPVIVIFLAIYGLFSGWTWRRTGHRAVGGLALAIAFAWAIAATFPMIDPSALPG
ncbi:MAG: alpha/beta fold hydrolase [Azospirillaceae bacterium]